MFVLETRPWRQTLSPSSRSLSPTANDAHSTKQAHASLSGHRVATTTQDTTGVASGTPGTLDALVERPLSERTVRSLPSSPSLQPAREFLEALQACISAGVDMTECARLLQTLPDSPAYAMRTLWQATAERVPQLSWMLDCEHIPLDLRFLLMTLEQRYPTLRFDASFADFVKAAGTKGEGCLVLGKADKTGRCRIKRAPEAQPEGPADKARNIALTQLLRDALRLQYEDDKVQQDQSFKGVLALQDMPILPPLEERIRMARDLVRFELEAAKAAQTASGNPNEAIIEKMLQSLRREPGAALTQAHVRSLHASLEAERAAALAQQQDILLATLKHNAEEGMDLLQDRAMLKQYCGNNLPLLQELTARVRLAYPDLKLDANQKIDDIANAIRWHFARLPSSTPHSQEQPVLPLRQRIHGGLRGVFAALCWLPCAQVRHRDRTGVSPPA